MSRRTDLEFIDHVPMRVHGPRMTDTYVMVTRIHVLDAQDPCSADRVYHVTDGDAAEELLFAAVQGHHGQGLVATYQWYEAFEAFITVLQLPSRELGEVALGHWAPDTDLAVLDCAAAPGVGHEFWLEDFPVSASFTEVTQEEYDRAMRPVTQQ